MFSCKPACFSTLGRAANRYIFLQPNIQKAYVHGRANPFCNGFLCVRQHPAASGSFLWPTRPGSARQPPHRMQVRQPFPSTALVRDPKEHTAHSCYLQPHRAVTVAPAQALLEIPPGLRQPLWNLASSSCPSEGQELGRARKEQQLPPAPGGWVHLGLTLRGCCQPKRWGVTPLVRVRHLASPFFFSPMTDQWQMFSSSPR